MKILVAYSGGKDSQACLIWAVNKYGADNVTAVFCDTHWENPITYHHIESTTNELGVKLVTLTNSNFGGMLSLSIKKKRFPSTKARFCTEQLKAVPFIDFVLRQKDNLLIIQGIRASESASRAKMSKQCRYFKYYSEPYNDKGRKHSYRKDDVVEWCANYSDDILRPVFDWSGQEVIDYIIANGHRPNVLYSQGFKRVGCFPCIMSGQREVLEIIERYPERFEEIIKYEELVGRSFFPPDYVPKHARSGLDQSTGKSFPTAKDVRKYLQGKNATLDIFETPKFSCSSYYHLCE